MPRCRRQPGAFVQAGRGARTDCRRRAAARRGLQAGAGAGAGPVLLGGERIAEAAQVVRRALLLPLRC